MDLTPALQGLDDRERILLEGVLRGLSHIASATAAGYKSPKSAAKDVLARPHVAAALERARSLSIQETGITRAKVSEMLMDAYRNAATAGEQVMAARELAKLHGLYEAQKVEVKHRVEKVDSERELRQLPTDELLRLARMNPANVIEGQFSEVRLPVLPNGHDPAP